jgi:hypothetical protein
MKKKLELFVSLSAFGVENPELASPMIALVKQSLERHRKPLSVLFVISERDRPVYDEFVRCLATIPTNKATDNSIPRLQISLTATINFISQIHLFSLLVSADHSHQHEENCITNS